MLRAYKARAKILRRLAGLTDWMADNEDGQDCARLSAQARNEAKELRKRADMLYVDSQRNSTERSER